MLEPKVLKALGLAPTHVIKVVYGVCHWPCNSGLVYTSANLMLHTIKLVEKLHNLSEDDLDVSQLNYIDKRLRKAN